VIKMNKKGFFFVVVTFLILTYILTSIASWTMAIQTSEKRFSEKFRTSNIETIIEQVTEEKLNKVASINAKYALQELGMYSVENPVKVGEPGDEYSYINKSMYELMILGEADGDNFVTGKTFPFASESSMFDWTRKLNATINKIGFTVSEFSVSNFNIYQKNIESVEYSFKVHLVVEEKAGKTSISRNYNINGIVSIQGMVDPMSEREAKKEDIDLGKQFFFNEKYNETGDMNAEKMADEGSEGQGWFYGPVVTVDDASTIDPWLMESYILVGSYDNIMGLDQETEWGQFGAYILTTEPELEEEAGGTCYDQSKTLSPIDNDDNCVPKIKGGDDKTDKPFMVLEDYSPSGPILFIAENSPQGVENSPNLKFSDVDVYFIENFRDFVMCGYYTHNENAPSFFQRMFEDALTMNDSELGIESFIVGKFVGGSEAKYSDSRSRLDRELFLNPAGTNVKIRGMPGCKSPEMCDNDNSILGHFRMSEDAINDYLVTDIACNDGRARCN